MPKRSSDSATAQADPASALKDKLVCMLEQIPGVSHQEWPERDDGFSTVHYADKEIAHFHSYSEIDIRLGKQLIAEQKLQRPRDSIVHPKRSKNSPYIELPVSSDEDLDRIVQLVTIIASSTRRD